MVTIFLGALQTSYLCMGGELIWLCNVLKEYFALYLLFLKSALLFLHSAYFHDYHHRLLYTKSGNYSSTFTYMDW